MKKLLAAATAVVACAILTAAPAQAHEEGSDIDTPITGETAVALAEARAGTAAYLNVSAALADGYVPVSPCISVPGLGTMGIHYANFGLVDATHDPAQPEVLVYNPDENGRLRLVAVEYMSTVPAEFAGGVHFDPPANGLPFSLHAWVWKNNPSGMFAGFNPSAHC